MPEPKADSKPRSIASNISSGTGGAQLLRVPVARAARHGFDHDGDAGGVVLAADYLVELFGVRHVLRDRLAVGDLGIALLGGYLEVADDARHEDVEVELAHARDDDLARIARSRAR